VVFTTVTDAAGGCAFPGLPASDFDATVVEGTLPAGLGQTADPDTELDGRTGLTLTDGETSTERDFGYVGTTSLSGVVFRVNDNDGTRDAGEAGIADTDVVARWAGPDGLIGTNDEVRYRTSTDASGSYEFTDLPAGPVMVSVVSSTLPSGPGGFLLAGLSRRKDDRAEAPGPN
jgi:hypothetical protein